MKKNIFRPIVIIIITVFCLTYFKIDIYAQDTGQPAMQPMALYTIGGAVGGALLGAAFYLMDPYAPEANLRKSLLVGGGLGVFAGALFGGFQYVKQMTPIEREPIAPPDELPQGNRLRIEDNDFDYDSPPKDGVTKPRMELVIRMQILNFTF